MPTSDSKRDLSFFMHGMEIKSADWLPPGADFAIQSPTGRYQFFGLDKASPNGDYSAVHRVYPSFRFDKGLLDGLSEDELKASDYIALEMRAMKMAADMAEAQNRALLGATTANEPTYNRTFRWEDYQRILDTMHKETFDTNVKVVEALIKAGFTVTCNDVSETPVAVLPESFREAFNHVTRPRGIWPQEYIDSLRDMDRDEWVKQYEGSFGPFEGQIPIDEDEENN